MNQPSSQASTVSNILVCPKFADRAADMDRYCTELLMQALSVAALTPTDAADVSTSGMWRTLSVQNRVPAAKLAVELLTAGFGDSLREKYPCDVLTGMPWPDDPYDPKWQGLTQTVLIRKSYCLVTTCAEPVGVSTNSLRDWLNRSPLGWLLATESRRHQTSMGIPVKQQKQPQVFMLRDGKLSRVISPRHLIKEPSQEVQEDWKAAIRAWNHRSLTPATGQRCYTCPYPCNAGIVYRTRTKK